MIRPLILAVALLAPAVALAQTAPLPPASTAPATATPPAVSGDGAGMGRYGGGGGGNATPEMRQARQAMMQSCSADFTKYCADAPAGGGGRMQCLRQHQSELSDGCRGSMQAMRAARQGGAGATPQAAASPPG